MVLKLENVSTQTAGTLTDTVIVLEIVQDSGSTGQALTVSGGGVTFADLDTITDIRSVCATAAGILELVDGTCGTSSERFKENISTLSYGLSEFMSLRPVFFNYIDDLGTSGRTNKRIGLIAEEVYEVLPEVVLFQDGVIESIDYLDLVPLNIKVIQEQQKQIESLEGRIDRLESLLLDGDVLKPALMCVNPK